MLLLHGYLWWRLVRSTTRSGRARRLLTLGLGGLAVLPVGAVLLRREDSPATTALQWVGFSWLGVAFYLFLTLLALEPVRWVATWAFRRAESRRTTSPTTDTCAEEVVPSGGRRPPRRDDAAARGDGGTAPGRGAVRQDGDVHSGSTAVGTAPGSGAVGQDGDVTDPSRRLLLARGLAATAGVA